MKLTHPSQLREILYSFTIRNVQPLAVNMHGHCDNGAMRSTSKLALLAVIPFMAKHVDKQWKWNTHIMLPMLNRKVELMQIILLKHTVEGH